jgi:uncharacterized membrane protein YhiD involved in acid resistance
MLPELLLLEITGLKSFILQKSNKIEGLTTAATIWCSAGAGCLAAVSMFGELAFLTVLVVIINIVFESSFAFRFGGREEVV